MSSITQPMSGPPPSAVRRAQPGLFGGILILAVLVLTSCSPRDFLTRRLATDLIASSQSFNSQQQYVLRTGIVSNKDFLSPQYLVLQRHGWISPAASPCTPGLTPAPCWDILLTPSGVETIRVLVPDQDPKNPSITIPVAKRELIAVTGLSRQGSVAEVEFAWNWIPVNEVGEALFSGELHYKSSVGFRKYDDGWRIEANFAHPGQSMEDALKNAEPIS